MLIWLNHCTVFCSPCTKFFIWNIICLWSGPSSCPLSDLTAPYQTFMGDDSKLLNTSPYSFCRVLFVLCLLAHQCIWFSCRTLQITLDCVTLWLLLIGLCLRALSCVYRISSAVRFHGHDISEPLRASKQHCPRHCHHYFFWEVVCMYICVCVFVCSLTQS